MNTTTQPATTDELLARTAWSIIADPAEAAAGIFTAAHGYTDALSIANEGQAALTAELTKLGLDAVEIVRRWAPRLHDLQRQVDAALEAAEQQHVKFIDPATIPCLSDLGHTRPHLVWARGNTDNLTAPIADKIAIVGARAATAYGTGVTADIARDLASAGKTIVSGGAYGVDAAAHRAVASNGSPTIVWFAGGVTRLYPEGNRAVFDEVLNNGGTLAAILPPNVTPTRQRFLTRNAIIAATTAATIVTEAGWRSGALNTSEHARALGRPLGAVPGPVTSASSAGCHRLLREFGASCITSAQDIIDLIDNA